MTRMGVDAAVEADARGCRSFRRRDVGFDRTGRKHARGNGDDGDALSAIGADRHARGGPDQRPFRSRRGA